MLSVSLLEEDGGACEGDEQDAGSDGGFASRFFGLRSPGRRNGGGSGGRFDDGRLSGSGGGHFGGGGASGSW